MGLRSLDGGEDGSGYEALFYTCGICRLMKDLGLYDLTPTLYRFDYSMNKASVASKFVRKYTPASVVSVAVVESFVS